MMRDFLFAFFFLSECYFFSEYAEYVLVDVFSPLRLGTLG